MALNLQKLKDNAIYEQDVDGLTENYKIIVRRNVIGAFQKIYESFTEDSTDEDIVKQLCEIISDNPSALFEDMVAMEDSFLTFFEIISEIVSAIEKEITSKVSVASGFSSPTIPQAKR